MQYDDDAHLLHPANYSRESSASPVLRYSAQRIRDNDDAPPSVFNMRYSNGRRGMDAKPPVVLDTRKRRVALLRTYAIDWIVTILIVAAFFSLDKIHGYWREFSLTDTSIQHTFAVEERVPAWALYIIAFVAPVVLMPLVNVLTIRSWWDWHNSWLGLLLGLALTGVLTQAVKLTVGRPRPDFIDRCNPIPGSQNASPYGLATSAICQQTDMAKLKDGFRSFFSGHSSLSFAGLGFLSWYLAGKLHLFDRNGHAGKAWVSMTPLLGAALVAISRTMDNRHHWHDVLVGSIVGTLFSYFAYRQYYPSLTSPMSHLPYEPRIKSGSIPSRGSHEHGRHHSTEMPLAHSSTIRRSSNDLEAGVFSSSSSEDVGSGSGSGNARHDEQMNTDGPLEGTVRRGGEPLEELWKNDGRTTSK